MSYRWSFIDCQCRADVLKPAHVLSHRKLQILVPCYVACWIAVRIHNGIPSGLNRCRVLVHQRNHGLYVVVTSGTGDKVQKQLRDADVCFRPLDRILQFRELASLDSQTFASLAVAHPTQVGRAACRKKCNSDTRDLQPFDHAMTSKSVSPRRPSRTIGRIVGNTLRNLSSLSITAMVSGLSSDTPRRPRR